LRIVRRCSGSVVTWRRAQMVLLSAQGMDITQIARVAFTSPDRVRDVINNFNENGFESLYPRYAGGRPPTFTLGQRPAIKKIASEHPASDGGVNLMTDHMFGHVKTNNNRTTFLACCRYLRSLYPPEVRIVRQPYFVT
jgi:hypothetical protein